MKLAGHVAITTLISWVVLAATCLAQSEETPDIEFHAPFRTSVAETPQELPEQFQMPSQLVPTLS